MLKQTATAHRTRYKNKYRKLRSRFLKLLRKRDGGVWCEYCGVELQVSNCKNKDTYATIDHVIPLSEEPSHYLNLRNFAPSCYYCNAFLKDEDDTLRQGFVPLVSEVEITRINYEK